MSKNTAISIILGFLLIFGGGLAYWYYSLSPQKQDGVTEPSDQKNNLFPFGQTTKTTPSNTSSTSTTDNTTTTATPEVREISSTATAGFTPFLDLKNKSFVRYIEEETGNVYEAPLDIVSTRRISNTTIPKVQAVVWLPQAKAFIASYLGENTDTIQSFYGDINLPQTEGGEGNVSGKFLEDNITGIVSLSPLSASTTSKNPGKIFYIKNTDRGTAGYSALQNGSNPKLVFSSPLSEWLILNSGSSNIFLQTKSSGLSASYLFSLNTNSGALGQVLGNITGLSSLPNRKGDNILYSETLNKKPLLHIYKVTQKSFSTIGLNTFADKCAWFEGATSSAVSAKLYCAVPSSFPEQTIYPDSWYQGKTTFNDDLWEINVATLETKKVASLIDNSFYLDVWNPLISADGKYFVFINKRDLTLWSVHLAN